MMEDPNTEVAKWKLLYTRMRNIAAGYSNQVADEANTKRLDKDFNECEELARNLQSDMNFPTR